MDLTFRRPDPEKLARCLEADPFGPAGAILRLAWYQGLTREEICSLRWEAVDFDQRCLLLPDRAVPFEGDTEECLHWRWERYARRAPFVILSDRDKTALTPESVSRLARRALAAAGEEGLKLMDLRHDFVQRQVERRGWAYAARVSGMYVGTVQSRFTPSPAEAPPPKEKPQKLDEVALWKVMQQEKTSPAGLALWLTWQLGLREKDIVDLTWDQVDLESGELVLEGGRLPLTQALWRSLQQVREARAPGADPHVVLTAVSGSPMDPAYLSRLTRTALIRGGLEDVTLRRLRTFRGGTREDQEAQLLHQAEKRGALTRAQAAQLLGVGEKEAYACLRRLAQRGRLVRVGGRYYAPGAVVPPAEQADTVRAYLKEMGFAYRQDLARLLGIGERQCSHVLGQMVKEGVLVMEDKRYSLPEEAIPAGGMKETKV